MDALPIEIAIHIMHYLIPPERDIFRGLNTHYGRLIEYANRKLHELDGNWRDLDYRCYKTYAEIGKRGCAWIVQYIDINVYCSLVIINNACKYNQKSFLNAYMQDMGQYDMDILVLELARKYQKSEIVDQWIGSALKAKHKQKSLNQPPNSVYIRIDISILASRKLCDKLVIGLKLHDIKYFVEQLRSKEVRECIDNISLNIYGIGREGTFLEDTLMMIC